MTQQELDAMLLEQEKALLSLGIPISREIVPQVEVNTRAQRRLGCCVRKDGVFTIQVSVFVLEDQELVRTTLVHELLHTCYGCLNHGKRWKAYAAKAGEALGLDIQRTVTLEGQPQRLRQDSVKYLLKCKSCGAVIPRRRMSKAVKHPERYRCPCGGKLERVEGDLLRDIAGNPSC